MNLTLIVIQIILAFFLVVVILLQKSGSEGWSSMASNPAKMGGGQIKSRSNPLVKVTTIIAILFIANSLLLANFASKKDSEVSIIEKNLKDNDNKTKSTLAPIAD
jgi:preprotein translocase subunit SecG